MQLLMHSRAAELLTSLATPNPVVSPTDTDLDSHMHDTDAPPVSSYRLFSTSYDDPKEAALEVKEAHKYLLAKSYFDTREYDRCAAVFLPIAAPAGGLAMYERSKGRTPLSTPQKPKGKSKLNQKHATNPFPPLSQKSLFLALYARYIAGEKRKDEESEMVLGPADGGQTTNRELPALARGLEGYFDSKAESDPESKHSQGWLEYLYGVVLAKSKHDAAAQHWLLQSVRLNPYHWGAWEELSSLLSNVDDLSRLFDPSTLPQNVMTVIYQTHAAIDLSSTSDARTTYTSLQSLLQIFPKSTFLQTELALLHYHSKEFDSAATLFQEILTSHPHRLDALDHYSNILYVMSDRPKLSFLAHLATSTDKFRPETCCVVGNYYSLCSQHEKAVMYFRRALTLDRSFLSAWTLMGHEYIEMKNTHAAIESYRRAVDVNRKDYRAWYGLGQAYEVLDMGFYALFYYQRAAALRPYDPKMWQAVGSCYAKMGRAEQSIKALKRALVAGTYYETVTPTPTASFKTSVGSTIQGAEKKGLQGKAKTTGRKLLDPEILHQIAGLYEKVGDLEEAAKYMELTVAQETGASGKAIARLEKEKRKREMKAATQEERRQRAMEVDEQRRMGGDEDDFADGDTEILTDSGSDDAQDSDTDEDEDGEADGFGTGTTATTSKARLWLARWAWRRGDLDRAEKLAEELCMDGYEVEEAKGLVREVRGRREAGAGTSTGTVLGASGVP
jgi:anaphase-promoting complex subunit 8